MEKRSSTQLAAVDATGSRLLRTETSFIVSKIWGKPDGQTLAEAYEEVVSFLGEHRTCWIIDALDTQEVDTSVSETIPIVLGRLYDSRVNVLIIATQCSALRMMVLASAMSNPVKIRCIETMEDAYDLSDRLLKPEEV